MVASFASCSKKANSDETLLQNSEKTTAQETVLKNNPLTNESGFNQDMVGKRPIAIMINNAPKARPQWGLTSADAVFEFCVEGGVTRMMWLFADYESLPDKIGPIRSARHHFVYTAESLDAIYTHWGGSVMAKDVLKKDKVDDIDGITYEGKYFYRDKTRNVAIEHRGISDKKKLNQAITDLKIRTDLKKDQIGGPFVFAADDQKLSGGACSDIHVSFSEGYDHTFKYDAGKNVYYNYMNSSKFIDANNDEQMAVSNVIVLYAPTKTLQNELCDVDLTGGKGVYVTNGTYQEIRWKKGNNGTDELKLTYADNGSQVKLNTGKSWIGFVPTDRESKTTIA